MASRSLRVAILRGGTSRGVFIAEDDAPPPGDERDRLMVRMIGSPEPGQVDGLGGGLPTTSKVAVIGAAVGDPDAEVRYQVGNVAIDEPVVDWRGTCGNLTAAAPVFAIREGLVPVPTSTSTIVRLRNISTNGLIRAVVPTLAGSIEVDPGAQVRTEYLSPEGSVFPNALPLGAPQDVLRSEGRDVRFSLVDVTHPYLFVDAESLLGWPGPWDPGHLSDAQTLARLEAVRADVAVRLGVVADPARAASESPSVPRLVLVAPGRSRRGDIEMLAVSMGKPIRSIPMTAAMCAAAARLLPGTLLADYAPTTRDVEMTTFGGPSGLARALAERAEGGRIKLTAVERTSRYLMRGDAALPM